MEEKGVFVISGQGHLQVLVVKVQVMGDLVMKCWLLCRLGQVQLGHVKSNEQVKSKFWHSQKRLRQITQSFDELGLALVLFFILDEDWPTDLGLE